MLDPSPELMQAYKDIQIGHKMKYIIFSLKKDGVDAANKTVWKWNIDKVRGHSNGPAAAAPAAAAPAPTATATAGGARMGGAAPMVTAASPAAITPAASPGPAAGPAPAAGAGHPRRTSGAGQDAQGNEAAWAELMSTLPRDDGVFVLFDWGGKASDGRIIDKLLLLKWCPDNVNVELKMLMGSTWQNLKQKLTGLSKDVQAASPSGLAYKDIAATLAA